MLAQRTARMSASPTHEGGGRGRQAAAAQGVDVVDFGAGEPDFPTRRSTSRRPRTRRSTPTSRSTRPTAGTDELKQAIAARYKHRLRRRVHAGRGHRHRRRQAGALQRRAGAVRRRATRSSRTRPAGRRSPSRSSWPTPTPVIVRTHAGGRVRAARRAVPGRDHAAHARHHHQLAGQPDRRADAGGGARERSPTRPRGAASGSCSTSATRS